MPDSNEGLTLVGLPGAYQEHAHLNINDSFFDVLKLSLSCSPLMVRVNRALLT